MLNNFGLQLSANFEICNLYQVHRMECWKR